MTGTGAIHISFAPLWACMVSGTTILREPVYDTSGGSKTLTHALRCIQTTTRKPDGVPSGFLVVRMLPISF